MQTDARLNSVVSHPDSIDRSYKTRTEMWRANEIHGWEQTPNRSYEIAKPLFLISRALASNYPAVNETVRSTINVSSAWNYVCIGAKRYEARGHVVATVHMIPFVGANVTSDLRNIQNILPIIASINDRLFDKNLQNRFFCKKNVQKLVIGN